MKYTAICIALLCALLIVPFASAALSATDVSLPIDQSVRRSNPLLTRSDSSLDDTSELSYVTFNIPVTATTQAETINSITPVLSGFSYDSFANNLNTSYEFYVDTPLPLVVAAGQTQTVTVRVLVPSNIDSVDSNFNDVAHTVSVNMQTTAGVLAPRLTFYAENELQLKKVELTTTDGNTIRCRINQGSTTLDCDSDADKMPLGQNFDAAFTIKNQFSRNANVNLNSIDVSLDSDNSDVDPADTSFTEDLNSGDETIETTTFTVDSSIQDGDNARITFQADVTDDNGARHGFSHDFTVRFNAKDYELNTPKVTVAPNSVCPGQSTVFTYTLQNLGSREQTNVRPVVSNDILGINKVLNTVDLKASGRTDDTFRGTANIVVPTSAVAGTYPIQLITYYRDDNNNNDATILQTATMTVQNCNGGSTPVNSNTGSSTGSNSGSTNTGSGSTSGNTGSTGGVVVVQPGQGTTGTGYVPPATTATGGSNVPVRAVASDNSDTPFLIGLGVAVLVLVAVVGLLIAAMRK